MAVTTIYDFLTGRATRQLGRLRERLSPGTIHGLKAIVAFTFLCAAYVYGQRSDTLATLMDVPASVVLLSAVGLTVIFVTSAQQYIHERFRSTDFIAHNDVAGFVVAVVGSLYAVLLGFLTVVAWEHFSEAQQLVAQESAAAADTWHVAVGLPDARRARVREDVLMYANVMLHHEWIRMRTGGFDKRADLVVMDAMSAAGNFNPRSLRESNAQTATIQELGVLHDFRQRRLADNAGGINGFEWLVLIVGASCVIFFCWLFGVKNSQVHLMMTSAVAVLVTATLVLLFELQYPFRSNLAIDANDWVAVINHIHVMQAGGQMDMRML